MSRRQVLSSQGRYKSIPDEILQAHMVGFLDKDEARQYALTSRAGVDNVDGAFNMGRPPRDNSSLVDYFLRQFRLIASYPDKKLRDMAMDDYFGYKHQFNELQRQLDSGELSEQEFGEQREDIWGNLNRDVDVLDAMRNDLRRENPLANRDNPDYNPLLLDDREALTEEQYQRIKEQEQEQERYLNPDQFFIWNHPEYKEGDELPESARAGKGRVSMYEMPSMRFNKMRR